MTLGKEAPPLPMYERKVLKHVPTMVRRRYDRDLDSKFHANRGLPSEDHESKGGDGGADDVNPAAANDVDDFVDDEACEDELHANVDADEEETQTYADDFEHSNFRQSASIKFEDNKIESCEAKDENMDGHVLDEVEGVGRARFDNDRGLPLEGCESNGGDGTEDVNSCVVDHFVGDEADEDKSHSNFVAIDEDTQTYMDGFGPSAIMYSEGNKSKCGGTSFSDANVQYKNKDVGRLEFDKDKVPLPLPMYERVMLKHVPTIVRRRYDWAHEKKFDATQGIPSEDRESKGDGGADDASAGPISDVDDFVDGEAEEDETHTNFDADEEETQTYAADFKHSNLRSIPSVNSEECKRENGEAEYASLDANVLDKVDNVWHAKVVTDQGGAGSEDTSSSVVSDVNNFVDKGGDEDKLHEDFDAVEEETQAYTDDFGHSDSGSSANNKGECRGAGDAIPTSFSVSNAQDKTRDVGHADIDNGRVPPPLPMYEREILKHVPTMVRRRYNRDPDKTFDTTPGLLSEDGESIGDDVTKEVNSTGVNDVDIYVDDEADEDESLSNFNADEDAQTYTDNFGQKSFGSSASMYSEDSKSDTGGAEDASLASSLDVDVHDEIEDMGQAKFEKDLISADLRRKGEDGTEDANSTVSDLDDNEADEDESHANFDAVEEDTQSYTDFGHIKSGPDCKSKSGGAGDPNLTSYLDDDVQDKFEDVGRAKFYNDQGLLSEDSKSQVEVSEDEDPASYVDDGIRTKLHNKGHGNSDNVQDFSPKAFKKTLERDGYDLCCPRCKQLITHTMIIRRREDCCQHPKTTCSTFLTAIFSCLRW